MRVQCSEVAWIGSSIPVTVHRTKRVKRMDLWFTCPYISVSVYYRISSRFNHSATVPLRSSPPVTTMNRLQPQTQQDKPHSFYHLVLWQTMCAPGHHYISPPIANLRCFYHVYFEMCLLKNLFVNTCLIKGAAVS